MIKILYFNPSSNIGGAEKSLLDILKNIDRKVYNPVLVIPEDGKLGEKARSLNLEVLIIKLPRVVILSGRQGNIKNAIVTILMLLSIPVAIFRITRLIKSSGASIVHTNGLKFHMLCSIPKLFLRFKLVWHFRDIPDEWLWKAIILLFAYFFPDKIIVNSDVVGNLFVGKNTKRKTVRIFNCIDIKNFLPKKSREDVRRSLGLSNEFVVGMFSMFTEWKGHTVLLKAAEMLKAKGNQLRFLIAGDAVYKTLRNQGYKENLLAICSMKELNGIVKFIGFIEDVADLINAVDIVVNPSTKPEPFGRVIVEAMALEKPVIITDGGGLSGIVSEHNTGIVVPRNDAKALSEAIYKLYSDPELRKDLTKKSRDIVAHYFSIEGYIKGIENIYKELLR